MDGQLKEWGKRFDLYIPDLIFFGGSTSTNPDFNEEYQVHCCLKVSQSTKSEMESGMWIIISKLYG